MSMTSAQAAVAAGSPWSDTVSPLIGRGMGSPDGREACIEE